MDALRDPETARYLASETALVAAGRTLAATYRRCPPSWSATDWPALRRRCQEIAEERAA